MGVRVNHLSDDKANLRRYSKEEYAVAMFADCVAGDPKRKRYNRMENLEALYFRGFKHDEQNMTYTEPKTGVSITESSLWYKGAYKEVDAIMEMRYREEDPRTSEEWQKVCKVEVIDPDGWDRSSPAAFHRSWHEEKITREEFEGRIGPSTCLFPTDAFVEGFNMWKDPEEG